MRRAARSPGAPVACAFALLSLAWVLVVPPFGNADEADHHVRVQGLAAGALLGEPAAPVAEGLTPLARAWVAQTTRRMPVEPGRVPEAPGCFAEDARTPATCADALRGVPDGEAVTQVGTYQPLPYLLPAAAAKAGPSSPAAALRLERLASLLPALLLLAGAALVAGGRPGLLAGVVLAASPAALLVAAAPGGSGLEAAGAIALITALLARDVRGALALALAGGLALVLARSLGPLWLALCLLAIGGLRRLPRCDRGVLLGAGALLAAVIVQRLWEGAHGPTPPRVELVPAGESLRAGLRMLPDVLREAVGTTGYLELRLGWVLVLPWLGAVAALVVLALRAAGRRERVVLVATAAVAVLLPAYLFAGVVRHTGFGVQGRHLLPVLALVPLLAGALVARPPRALLPIAAAVHLAAVLVLARRYAVGTDGPVLFPGEGWSPPGGWLPPLLLAAAGAVLLTTAARDRAAAPPCRDLPA